MLNTTATKIYAISMEKYSQYIIEREKQITRHDVL